MIHVRIYIYGDGAGDKKLVDSDSLRASTSAEVLMTGEAVVNNRKNKLIPAYELEITGAWSGNSWQLTVSIQADPIVIIRDKLHLLMPRGASQLLTPHLYKFSPRAGDGGFGG